LSKKFKSSKKNTPASPKTQNSNNLKLSYKVSEQTNLIQQIDSIKFKTETQKNLYKEICDNYITFVAGPAGTGKTFISLWTSLNLLFNGDNYKKIYITKPYKTAGEDFGFLPGGIAEKFDPLLASYYWNLEKIIGTETYRRLISHKIIEIVPIAYMRGITFENCIVLLDEAQNTSPEQLELLLTRLGDDAKIIVMGDIKQSDIRTTSGLGDAMLRFKDIEDIGMVEFMQEDVVRHPLVKKIIAGYENELIYNKEAGWKTEFKSMG